MVFVRMIVRLGGMTAPGRRSVGLVTTFRTIRGAYGLAPALRHLGNNVYARLVRASSPGRRFVVGHGTRFLVHPDAWPAFRYFTLYDPDMIVEVDVFRRLTSARRRLFDIGAHYGLFTLVFTSRSEAEAVAFEPSPEAYAVLSHNARLNPGRRIRTIDAALGASKATVEMAYEGTHLVATELSGGDPSHSVRMPLSTVDSYVDRFGVAPDVLKIDVEGYELEVLRGARSLLATARPLVFLEIHPGGTAEPVRALQDLLMNCGYVIYDLTLSEIHDLAGFCGTRIRRVVCTTAPPRTSYRSFKSWFPAALIFRSRPRRQAPMAAEAGRQPASRQR